MDKVCKGKTRRTGMVEMLRKILKCFSPKRKSTGDKLTGIPQQFQDAFLESPFPMIIHAEDGEILHINKVWTELTGYRPDEIPTITEWTRLAYGAGMEVARSHINKLFYCEGRFNEGEFSLTNKNGATLVWDFSSALLDKLPDGRRLVISIAKDVTDCKQAEMALRAIKERYRVLVEGMDNFVTRVDNRGRFTYINPACEIFFGVSQKECIGLSAFIFVHSDDLESTKNSFAGWVQNKTDSITFENRQLGKMGEVRDVLWTCKSVFDEHGEIVSFDSIGRDITERKQAEEKLRVQQYYLSKAQEIGLIGTWDFDVKKDILTWTKECYRIFGVDCGTVMSYAGFTECVHPDDREYVHSEWMKVEEGMPYDIEYRIVAGGKVKWVREKAELFFDDNSELILAIGVAQDITERKLRTEQLEVAKERAEAASVAKSQFLANMSHEIRTPISIIFGFSDMLMSESLTEDQMAYAELIRNAGKSLLVIINDILDYSKMEAGKLEVSVSRHPLKDIIGDVENMMRSLAVEKNLQFGVVCSKGLPEIIRTDQVRVNQCLVNLVNNAIKFTSDGYVYMKVSMVKSEGKFFVRFDVEDSGIGIAVDEQGHIFDSFSQVEKGSTRNFDGTGLGLAITSRLAGLLGGSVSLVSEEGKGSTFTLMIPTGIGAGGDKPAVKKTGGRKIIAVKKKWRKFSANVLVAEDHEGCQVIIRKLLERHGLTVTIANDGQEAIDKVLEGSFDLVFMDVRMPEYNGFEATGILREKGVKIPIIALTAHAMEGDRELCIEVGCNDYLTKPVEGGELLKLLAVYVGDRGVKV